MTYINDNDKEWSSSDQRWLLTIELSVEPNAFNIRVAQILFTNTIWQIHHYSSPCYGHKQMNKTMMSMDKKKTRGTKDNEYPLP